MSPPDPSPGRPEPSAPAVASRRVGVAVLAAVALAYVPAVTGEFLWDDHVLIVANPNVHDAARLPGALASPFWTTGAREADAHVGVYYRPVVTLSNFLLWQAGGGAPLPFHLANLALHLSCVALLAGLLRRRLGEGSDLLAWAAAGLFALFPSRAESVAWASGATDLYAAFFVLLGMKAFDELRRPWARIASASAAFVLGLLSKEVAVVAPALLLLDGVLLGRGGLKARLAVFLPVVAALGARAAVVPSAPPILAEGWADLLRVPASLGLYLAKTVWPWKPSLLVASRVRNEDGLFEYELGSVVLGFAAAALLVAAAILAVRKPGFRAWAADLGWLALPLAPVLNLLPTNLSHLVAERNLYLAHLGLFALAARAAVAVPAERKRVLVPIGLAAALALSSATVPHVMRLASQEETWAYEEEINPTDVSLLGFKARLHRQFGRPKEAALYALRIYAAQRHPPERVGTAAMLLGLAATLETDERRLEELVRFVEGLATSQGAETYAVLGTPIGAGSDPALRSQLAGAPDARAAREMALSKLAKAAEAAQRPP